MLVTALVAAAFVLAAPAHASSVAPVSVDHRWGQHDHQDEPDWWQDEDSARWEGAGGGWYGGESTSTQWRPEHTRELRIRGLRIDHAAISPNGDGVQDHVTVDFRLSRRSSGVRASVRDNAGRTVRQLGGSDHAGSDVTLRWDGRIASGALAPDGAYEVVLEAATGDGAGSGAGAVRLDVEVDTVRPGLTVHRPTIAQLRRLARTVAEAKRRRQAYERARARARTGRRHGNGHGHGNGGGQSARAAAWIRLWEEQQRVLPMRFATTETGEVMITTRLGRDPRVLSTWREQGRHRVGVVLPTYRGGGVLTVTTETADRAGNRRRHTTSLRLPDLPRPRIAPRRQTSQPAPDRPTSNGPLPDWLDPIMLRATYEAGVPQSWARSRALANIIQRESSFRPTAQNPTSTAYGLFQFLDQTWATVGCRKSSDAYRQSVCGLRYIQRRYHTPEAAWRFWQANHWY